MAVQVEFPDTLLVASRERPDTFARLVMIYTVGHLFVQGKISGGVGAQVLGCDLWEFYRLMSEHEFPVIDLSDREWEEEVRTSREIAARLVVEP